MSQRTKSYAVIITIVAALSLVFNFYFLSDLIRENSAVVQVDGNTVLTIKELNELLNDTYKINVVTEKTNNYLLELEAKKHSIKAPTDDVLNDLLVFFPSLFSYESSLTESNKSKAINIYYIYSLFQKQNFEYNKVLSFIYKKYGISDPLLYKVRLFETTDHNLASKIEKDLKGTFTIDTIEKKYDIVFSDTFTLSMEDLIAQQDESSENHHTESNIDSSMNNTNKADMNSNDTSNSYKKSDVFHVMNNNGNMAILYIDDIYTLDSNKKTFADFYFAQDYLSIRADLLNDLKSKYIIKY